MYSAHNVYYAYRKARRKFALKSYILFVLWLILALVQWLIVVFVVQMQAAFIEYFYISIVFFLIAILLFALFLFFERLRFNKAVAFILSFLIVEFQIIAVFLLVARSFWTEMLMYFAICVVLIFIFVVIGIVLPRRMDLTLHVALLFIVAFLFLIIAVYFLMLHLVVPEMMPYAYILVQLPITLTVLLFVMYHAQTINGGRFAEMRLHDFFLASLILFHDFLIIYLLTFYWQIWARLVTPNNWPEEPIRDASSSRPKYANPDYDNLNPESDERFIKLPRKIDRFRPNENLDTTKMKITLDFVRDDPENRDINALHINEWPNLWVAQAQHFTQLVYNAPEKKATPPDEKNYEEYY